MAFIELRAAAQQALEACKLIVSAFDALKPASAARNEPLQINAARASITALEAALAEPVQELGPWTLEQCDRVIRTLRYIEGIAARGEGRPMREDETLEQFILGYVQKLEAGQPAALAEPVQEPVAIVGTQADTWKGYEGQWLPPGPPIKTVHMLRALPEGTLLYTVPPQPPAEPVAYSVGRTLHWHEGKGVSDAQLFAAPPQRPAEPVQDHFRDARKMVHEPVQEAEMRRCPRCWEPMFPPQPTPLTVERLRDALVSARIVPPAAVEDPDGYDDGVTLLRIEALHRRLA